MKFLIDAHLPPALVRLLQEAGHDACHTRDLPMGNRTSDEEINRLSIEQQRIVVTKDADFVNSHIVAGRPPQLLLISTGNLRNHDLLALFSRNLDTMTRAFDGSAFVELTRTHVAIHR